MEQRAPKEWPKRGLKIVCISDTHNTHRHLDIPNGDILIHAGDWTHFGRDGQTEDFNEWLGTLPHKHKVVVNGNHEANAMWKAKAHDLLSNAHLLVQDSITLEDVKIYGTNFFWPVQIGNNPYFDQIPQDTEILICHGPARGYVDKNVGCPALRTKLALLRPRVVVSGHIHGAHGVAEGTDEHAGVIFVNAAICKDGYTEGWDPVVIEL